MDALDTKILNICQKDFPLCTDPWAAIGQVIGLEAGDVLSRIQKLKKQNKIGRIGAVVRSGSVGGSTLAAMTVPPSRLDEVAKYVSSFADVNHNYEREDDMNLWFVIATTSEKAVLSRIREIEAHTQLKVYDLRMQEAFHIDLGFDL